MRSEHLADPWLYLDMSPAEYERTAPWNLYSMTRLSLETMLRYTTDECRKNVAANIREKRAAGGCAQAV